MRYRTFLFIFILVLFLESCSSNKEEVSLIKENQILIGVLDPYNNNEKLKNLAKKKN